MVHTYLLIFDEFKGTLSNLHVDIVIEYSISPNLNDNYDINYLPIPDSYKHIPT